MIQDRRFSIRADLIVTSPAANPEQFQIDELDELDVQMH